MNEFDIEKKQEVQQILNTANLLRVEVERKLSDSPDEKKLLELLKDNATQEKFAEILVDRTPDTVFAKALKRELTDEEAEAFAKSVESFISELGRYEEISEEIKTAQEGANAVTLGAELDIALSLIDLSKTLAIVAMPVIAILVSRIKDIEIEKGKIKADFYEGIPKELGEILGEAFKAIKFWEKGPAGD